MANLLIPDLAGGQHTISGSIFNDINGNDVPSDENPALAGVGGALRQDDHRRFRGCLS